MGKIYRVIVTSQNSWMADGRPIVERDCGHRHRTLSGVLRCCDSLTKSYPDGTRSAAWCNAKIVRIIGDEIADLTPDESADVERMEYENFCR